MILGAMRGCMSFKANNDVFGGKGITLSVVCFKKFKNEFFGVEGYTMKKKFLFFVLVLCTFSLIIFSARGSYLPLVFDIDGGDLQIGGFLHVNGNGARKLKVDSLSEAQKSPLISLFVELRAGIAAESSVNALMYQKGSWEEHLEYYKEFVTSGSKNWQVGSEEIVAEYYNDTEGALVFKRSLSDGSFDPIDIVFFTREGDNWKVILNSGMHLSSVFSSVISTFATSYRRITDSQLKLKPDFFSRVAYGFDSFRRGYGLAIFSGIKYSKKCINPNLCGLNDMTLKEVIDNNLLDESSNKRLSKYSNRESFDSIRLFSGEVEFKGSLMFSRDTGVVLYSSDQSHYQFFRIDGSDVKLLGVGISDDDFDSIFTTIIEVMGE